MVTIGHGVLGVKYFLIRYSNLIHFTICFGQLTEGHRPCIITIYNDIYCTYFKNIPVVHLIGLELVVGPSAIDVGVFSLCPLPDWSAFVAEDSSSFAGTVYDNRVEEHPIGLALVVLVYQTQKFGVPSKSGVVASQ